VSLVSTKQWYLLRSGRCESAYNMALDEMLLEASAALGLPVLRFYGWVEPAASFGYFQKYEEVSQMTLLRPLIRRPTGGGLVPHDVDWTYSVAFPPNDDWYDLKATESYAHIHEWISAAFKRLGIETELAPECRKSLPGQCFIGYEKSDVLWHGKKIAGAAQRRNKFGLLIQGSVQPPPIRVTRNDWEQAMCEVAEVGWENLKLDSALLDNVERLVKTTYSQDSYNKKR
jgi:lipoyl(octanoyl) transferase